MQKVGIRVPLTLGEQKESPSIEGTRKNIVERGNGHTEELSLEIIPLREI